MSQYTTEILFSVWIVIIAWMTAAIISAIIWRITCRNGCNFLKIRRIHVWLAVLTPIGVVTYIISLSLSQPYTIPLFKYVITSLVSALPFLASLAGLCNAENQRRDKQGANDKLPEVGQSSHQFKPTTRRLVITGLALCLFRWLFAPASCPAPDSDAQAARAFCQWT